MLSELRYLLVNNIIRNINLINSSKCLIKLNSSCLLKSYQIQAPILQTRYLCSKYYSRKKVQVPSVIPVNTSNSHLKVDLYDEQDKQIGVMSMQEANEIAKTKELKLFLLDESLSTPKFRLMNGKELAQLRIEIRNHEKEKKEKVKAVKEKEIQVRVKCSEHDLQHKLNQIKEFYDKGYMVKITINTKLKDLEPTEITKIQDEFIKNLKSKIDYTQLNLYKKTEHEIIFLIANKKNEDSEEQNPKSTTTTGAKSAPEEQKQKQNPKSGASTGKASPEEQKQKQKPKSGTPTGKATSEEQKQKQNTKSASKPSSVEEKQKKK